MAIYSLEKLYIIFFSLKMAQKISFFKRSQIGRLPSKNGVLWKRKIHLHFADLVKKAVEKFPGKIP
jgi:hypothetical protein